MNPEESSRPGEGDSSTPSPQPPSAEGLQELSDKLAEVSSYLSLYLESQRDRLQLAIKQGLWGLALFPLGIFVVGGTILMALGFLGYGVATGLARLLGQGPWLGFLLTGVILLMVLGILLTYLFKVRNKGGLKGRRKQWKQELQKQRERFGHDAEERAAQA